MLRQALPFAVVLLAAVPTVLGYTALIGLGMARQGEPFAVTLSATALMFLPAFLAAVSPRAGRPLRAAFTQLVWASVLWSALPVYFPGERREAVATGLALVSLSGADDDDLARAIADQIPDEPELAIAQTPLAETVVTAPLPPPPPLDDDQIALPYEGEGRRLSVPVVFEHEGREIETYMMLDTGATYTTLSMAVLARLGATPPANAPELTLSTANGQRTAQVTLVDAVWLGDLRLEGIAITTCDDCAAEDHAGLLGLNVTGGYNLTIDADRREVVFDSRGSYDRRLDVKPFAELDGRFTRYPGGRVEFTLDLANMAPRRIGDATAQVSCGDQVWAVPIGAVEPLDVRTVQRRLPTHPRCASYRLELADAAW